MLTNFDRRNCGVYLPATYCEQAQRLATKQGSSAITVAVTDELGNYMVPTELYYHLRECTICRCNVGISEEAIEEVGTR